ncbi:MAG: MBL fold metallo-hydrolase [bacterium]
MKITFLGAIEEVAGSRYLVEHEDTKVLVDCGLFQGNSELRKYNWDKFPIDPSRIDAVVLTHAHIDHSGYIPVLVKNGFKNKIYCSSATFELCSILLVDGGVLQEEDANNANKHVCSSHHPALPLYTKIDAEHSLKFFQVIDYDTVLTIGKSLKITLIRSGHILGSSFITISDGKQTITFSGDLARPNQLLMKPPTHLKKTDFLVIESTYGDRLHEEGDPIKVIGEVVNKTVAKGGVLIIPAFAVGRTQTILYCLYQLKQKKIIPNIPIFLDSPMAINVTNLLCTFKDDVKLSSTLCTDICDIATYTRTREESRQIDRVKGSSIIIAASGMATGGRVLHHFRHFISDSKNTILFVGFQANGTTGQALVDGAKEIEIHGKIYSVHAEIKAIETFSGHADYNEILEWIGYFEGGPKKVFVTHGEIEAAQPLKKKIEERFGCSVVIPKYLESFELN